MCSHLGTWPETTLTLQNRPLEAGVYDSNYSSIRSVSIISIFELSIYESQIRTN